jgi:hypothetical protein
MRDHGHPYRWRTWLRTKLPWFLIDLGVAGKGEDCEKVGGEHEWYNHDGERSACYHCRVVRAGRLWDRDLDTTASAGGESPCRVARLQSGALEKWTECASP